VPISKPRSSGGSKKGDPGMRKIAMNLIFELRVPINDEWLNSQAKRRRVTNEEVLRDLSDVVENSLVDAVRWKDGVLGWAVASVVSARSAS
jgi:hypothetical protein